MSLFIPALPLLLADCVFSLQRECDRENHPKQHRQNKIGTADKQSNHAIKRGQEAPDHIRNRYEQREEESVIPVDDASPMTFSTLLLKCSETMADVGMTINIKLFLVYLFVFPCFIYLQLGLYNTLKKRHINESIIKRVSLGKIFTKHIPWAIFVSFGVKEIFWITTLTFTSLEKFLFLRPENFILKQGIPCPILTSTAKSETQISPWVMKYVFISK